MVDFCEILMHCIVSQRGYLRKKVANICAVGEHLEAGMPDVYSGAVFFIQAGYKLVPSKVKGL